jgi:hypothetical protein
MNNIPEDVEQIIEDILAYEEKFKEDNPENSNLEYAYDDYSEYPEDYEPRQAPDTKSTIIKIDL